MKVVFVLAVVVLSVTSCLPPGCDSAFGRICEKLGIPADNCRSR